MNLKTFAARAGIAAAALIGIASGKVMWSHAYDRPARAQHNSVLADMEARSRERTAAFFRGEQERAARNAAAVATIDERRWRRQTVAGLSFEAPFNFDVPPRDVHSQLLTAEAKSMTRWAHLYLPPDAPKEIYVAALAGEYTVAADEESAIAGGVDIMARQLNDKNPEYSVQPAPGSGKIGRYSKDGANTRVYAVARGNRIWGLTVGYFDPKGYSDPFFGDAADRIVASARLEVPPPAQAAATPAPAADPSGIAIRPDGSAFAGGKEIPKAKANKRP
jgi:hypothetical protein